jgi:hypothetical protein
MTTSFIVPTVSPDLIITTPTQLLAAFTLLWQRFKDDPNEEFFESFEEIAKSLDVSESAANSLEQMLAVLKELNGQ